MNKSMDEFSEHIRGEEMAASNNIAGSEERIRRPSSASNVKKTETETKGLSEAKEAQEDDKTKVKRKRKSPDKPWKKPPGMPKRPLSAYNLFYQAERERIIGQVSETAKAQGKKARIDPDQIEGPQEGVSEEKEEVIDDTKEGTTRRKGGVKKSGVGFGGLTRNISEKWNQLSQEAKEPYDKRAAIDKKRYDEEMTVWRQAQEEEKARASKATPTGAKTTTPGTGTSSSGEPSSESDPLLRSTVASVGDECIDDVLGHDPETTSSAAPRGDSYPADWFETGTDQGQGRARISSDLFGSRVGQLDASYGYTAGHVSGERPIASSMQIRQQQEAQSIQHSYASLNQEAMYAQSAMLPSSSSQASPHSSSIYQERISQSSPLSSSDRARYFSQNQAQQQAFVQRNDRDLQLQMFLQRQQHERDMSPLRREERRNLELMHMRQSQMAGQIEQRSSLRDHTSHVRGIDERRSQQGSSQERMVHFQSPYSQLLPRRQAQQQTPSSFIRSRANTPPQHPHQPLDADVSGFSPLTPVFGIPLEPQVVSQRPDAPFLFHDQDQGIDTEYRNRPDRSNQPTSRLPAMLQPRRSVNPLFSSEYRWPDGSDSLGLQYSANTDPQRLRMSGMDTYSERGTSYTRPAHRSASLSVIEAPQRTLEQHIREDEHRRYSVSGHTGSHYQFEPNMPLQQLRAGSDFSRVELSYPIIPTDARAPPTRTRADVSGERGDISGIVGDRTFGNISGVSGSSGVVVDDFWPEATNNNNNSNNVSARNNSINQASSSTQEISPNSILQTDYLFEKLDDDAIDFLTSMSKEGP